MIDTKNTFVIVSPTMTGRNRGGQGMSRTRWISGATGAATLILATVAIAPADVIVMKDGYVINGKTRREAETIIDPSSGQSFTVFKGSAYFIIDDRVRLVVFSHRQVEDADTSKSVHADHIFYTKPLGPRKLSSLPPQARIDTPPGFDASWDRTQIVRNEKGKFQIRQRLTEITPYYTRIEGHAYAWVMNYLTSELPREQVVTLLENHPDWQDSEGNPDAEKRYKRFRFCLQAGWIDRARDELEVLRKLLPAEKEKYEAGLVSLRQTIALNQWDQIERAGRAGQPLTQRKLLATLPVADLPTKLQAEHTVLRDQLAATEDRLKQAGRLMQWQLETQVGPWPRWQAEAIADLPAALVADNAERFEPYVTLASRCQTEYVTGRPMPQTHAELLAVALSGWLVSREAAEAKPEFAERLWAGRSLVRDYCRASNVNERYRILLEYRKQPEPLSLDEIAQLVPRVPAVNPDVPLANGAPLDRVAASVVVRRNGQTTYKVLPPPEYTPERTYPVLIALHATGETAQSAINRWGTMAARHGYILAAPEWPGFRADGFAYSAEDHAPIVDTVSDLKRRWPVDSDRIFMMGLGDGGTLATDAAFAHPDLFAGVIPICGAPKWTPSMWYWRNAQYLPFYCVVGELAGDTGNKTRGVFEQFMNKGYNSIMVVYKGRVFDAFPGELPFIFDWMSKKRRASAFPELGRNPNNGFAGEEFVSMRPEDNRFYWGSIGELYPKYINRDLATKQGAPAGIQATAREANQILMTTRGVKQASLWLGRITDARTGTRQMVDFEKPVRVDVNRKVMHNKLVKPDLEIMLEDLVQRGDRQRLFVARLDFDNLPN